MAVELNFTRDALYVVNETENLTTKLPSPDFLDGNSELERLERITSEMKSTCIWVVWAVGFPGNILCVLTVCSMKGSSPAALLVAALAVIDGLAITSKLIAHQLSVHNVYLGTVGCKTRFVSMSLATIANWILVLICAERYIAVCFPLQRAYVVTRRRCQIAVACLVVIIFVLFGAIYYVMRDSDESGKYCGTYNEYLDFWLSVWFWLNATLALFAPFMCIVVFIVLIVHGLWKSRRARRSILGSTTENGNGRRIGSNNHTSMYHREGNGASSRSTNYRLLQVAESVERSITIMLISAATIFLFLSLPSCIYLLSIKPLAIGESSNPIVNARWRLFDQIQFLLIDSTHAVNFILYFLSTHRFRKQLWLVLRCRCRVRRDPQSRTFEMTNSTHQML